MTTWGELLSDIRNDIKDTGTTPKFSDATLYMYLKDAIRDYSTYFPKRNDRAELTLNGSAYDLPADYLDDVSVECPLDRFLERRQERPGRRFTPQSKPTLYYIEGGALKLNGPTSEGVYLTYDALHPVPAAADDTTFALTIMDRDLELIRLYVKAKTNEQLRTKQANLDRFKLGSGNRQDNPIEPEVANLMDDYLTKIAERIGGRAIKLWRPGVIR